jgi:hypothetical protein
MEGMRLILTFYTPTLDAWQSAFFQASSRHFAHLHMQHRDFSSVTMQGQ